MFWAHEQRSHFGASGEVVHANQHFHVEATIDGARRLRFADNAEIEERRRRANRRLHATATGELPRFNMLKRQKIAFGAGLCGVRVEALLGELKLCGHRRVVEHQAGEPSPGDITELLEPFKVRGACWAHDISRARHARRLRTSNAPELMACSMTNDNFARSAKLASNANSWSECRPAATRAKRVNVRTPGSGQVVAFADAARGLCADLNANRAASFTHPGQDAFLLCVERLRRARDASMQMRGDAIALGLCQRRCGGLRVRSKPRSRRLARVC